MKKTLFAILACAVTAGCHTNYDPVMAQWDGRHIDDVTEQWGPAQKIEPDGSGGQIMTWIKPSPTDYESTEHKTFRVNSRGTIYDWSWTGSFGAGNKADYQKNKSRDPNDY